MCCHISNETFAVVVLWEQIGKILLQYYSGINIIKCNLKKFQHSGLVFLSEVIYLSKCLVMNCATA